MSSVPNVKIGAPSELPTIPFSCSRSACFRTILILIWAGETVIQRTSGP
jgi:hypothetical protein